ncbi:MAG TPA: hypothetical protein VHP33_10170 [Polyangiaceae bacterium]|nr:hypothetical protein [Polyangiaceae bacterium]
MTDPVDPSRLLDSSTAPAGLREVLQKASADVGTDAQVARLAERLGPLLGPAGPAAPVPAASKALSIKLGLVGAALIVAGGGAWLLSASPSSPPPPAPTAIIDRPPAPPPAAATTPPESLPSASQPVESTPSLAVEPAPPKLVEKPTPPAQPSEAELLEQARAALKSAPGRALQRANEHAARFPRGVLVQEREVLAIQALRGLGRDAEADRRAEAFAKAFPGSAFARKLNAPR